MVLEFNGGNYIYRKVEGSFGFLKSLVFLIGFISLFNDYTFYLFCSCCFI